MGVVDQRVLTIIAVIFVIIIVVAVNFKYWRRSWRRRKWPKQRDEYLKVLHHKLTNDGKQYTMLGAEFWDRISRLVKGGEQKYAEMGAKSFQALILTRIRSIAEDIKEDNAVAIRRRINKEYKEYLQRKEEQNDTNQPTD